MIKPSINQGPRRMAGDADALRFIRCTIMTNYHDHANAMPRLFLKHLALYTATLCNSKYSQTEIPFFITPTIFLSFYFFNCRVEIGDKVLKRQ